VIHQGFHSSIILNQKRICYELRSCWSIVPQGTKRPKHANTRLTHASPYILGVCKELQPRSKYFWNTAIFWQHALSYGLYLAMFTFFPSKYGNFVVVFTKRSLLDSQPFSFVAKWPYFAPTRTLFTYRGVSFQFCDIKNLVKFSNKLEKSIKFTVDKQKSSKKNLFMKIGYICIHSNGQESQIHFMPATWWFFQSF